MLRAEIQLPCTELQFPNACDTTRVLTRLRITSVSQPIPQSVCDSIASSDQRLRALPYAASSLCREALRDLLGIDMTGKLTCSLKQKGAVRLSTPPSPEL